MRKFYFQMKLLFGGITQVQKILLDYIHNLDAIRESMEPLMTMAWVMHRSADKEHLETLEELGDLIEDDGKSKKFEIPVENYRQVHKKRTRSSRASRALDFLPRLILISFVSEYDAFLGRVISHFHERIPSLLATSEKKLSVSEILEFNDFSDVKQRVLESEVETLLRKSHAEQFSWLENRFAIELRKGLDRWPDFIELTERRNLFVHTDGIISSQYIKVCKANNVDLSDLGVGQQLKASKTYLVDAYKCLYEFGVKLTHVLWRKCWKEELDDADSNLQSITYELLVEEKNELATRLLEFAVDTLPRHSCDIVRRIFIINLSQAYLFSGKEKLCVERLEKEDWSACSLNFQICVAVLKRDFESAVELMHLIGESGPVDKQDYLEWPVFRELRQEGVFSQAYESIFGEMPVFEEEHSAKQDARANSDEKPN